MNKPNFVNWVIIIANRYALVNYDTRNKAYTTSLLVDLQRHTGWYVTVYYTRNSFMYDTVDMLQNGITLGWSLEVEDLLLTPENKMLLLRYLNYLNSSAIS